MASRYADIGQFEAPSAASACCGVECSGGWLKNQVTEGDDGVGDGAGVGDGTGPLQQTQECQAIVMIYLINSQDNLPCSFLNSL